MQQAGKHHWAGAELDLIFCNRQRL